MIPTVLHFRLLCLKVIVFILVNQGKLQKNICKTSLPVTKAVLGQNVDLTCLINSSAFLWEKDTTILSSDGKIDYSFKERLKLQNGGQLLQILQAVKNDSGLYECYGGINYTKYKQCLKVLDKPVVEVNYERQELFCNASDWFDMTLVFTWEQLSKFKEHIRHIKSNNAFLALNSSNPEYLIDGNYLCNVESLVENGTKRLKAVSNDVAVQLQRVPMCIGNLSERVDGGPGDTVTLQKYVYGGLLHEDDIKWTHSNRDISITDDKFEITTAKTNITLHVDDSVILLEVYSTNMTIYRVVEEDFGIYTVNISGVGLCFLQLDSIEPVVPEDQDMSSIVLYGIVACVNAVLLVIIIAMIRACLYPYCNNCGSSMTSENGHQVPHYETTERSGTEAIHLYEELEMS